MVSLGQHLSRHVAVNAGFLRDRAAVLGVTVKETVCIRSSRGNLKQILACILLWACSLVYRALGAHSFPALSLTVRLHHWLICNYKANLRLNFPQEKLLCVGVAKSV
jgi:hypothetical protein